LGAAWLLPIHHSTFRLSREPMAEPLERLLRAAGAEAGRVVAREVGSSWTLPRQRAP
jgi:L-ascorbate metabolism protein UlaG (beta-lactamase superfamily)